MWDGPCESECCENCSGERDDEECGLEDIVTRLCDFVVGKDHRDHREGEHHSAHGVCRGDEVFCVVGWSAYEQLTHIDEVHGSDRVEQTDEQQRRSGDEQHAVLDRGVLIQDERSDDDGED